MMEKANTQKGKDDLSLLSYQVVDLASKLKLLENRYNILKRRADLLDDNVVELNREIREEMRLFQENYLELKKLVSDLNKKLQLVLEELDSVASKSEVDYIKTYVELINPLGFATKEDLEDLKRED